MKRIIIISFVLLASFGTALSQSILSLSFEPATPLGDMRNFIEKSSMRGLSASAGWFVTEKLTVGMTIQWTGFYQKEERATKHFDGGAVTANAWKEFYILPIYANAKYYFLNEEEARLLPYVGLNVGVAYIDQLLEIGTYEFRDKSWRFAFAPEVGTLIPMGMEKSWGFNVMLRYQIAVYNENNISLLQFLNYSFGVYWKIHPRGERY